MAHRACLRCGSDDLRLPGASDAHWEGSMSLSVVCRRCGYQGAPAEFDEAASYHSFRQAREALWRPGNGHGQDVRAEVVQPPSFPAGADRAEPGGEARRGGVTRGLFAVVGFVFLLAALGSFVVAAQGNWAALPGGLVAVLFSVPLLAVAARGRPRP